MGPHTAQCAGADTYPCPRQPFQQPPGLPALCSPSRDDLTPASQSQSPEAVEQTARLPVLPTPETTALDLPSHTPLHPRSPPTPGGSLGTPPNLCRGGPGFCHRDPWAPLLLLQREPCLAEGGPGSPQEASDLRAAADRGLGPVPSLTPAAPRSQHQKANPILAVLPSQGQDGSVLPPCRARAASLKGCLFLPVGESHWESQPCPLSSLNPALSAHSEPATPPPSLGPGGGAGRQPPALLPGSPSTRPPGSSLPSLHPSLQVRTGNPRAWPLTSDPITGPEVGSRQWAQGTTADSEGGARQPQEDRDAGRCAGFCANTHRRSQRSQRASFLQTAGKLLPRSLSKRRTRPRLGAISSDQSQGQEETLHAHLPALGEGPCSPRLTWGCHLCSGRGQTGSPTGPRPHTRAHPTWGRQHSICASEEPEPRSGREEGATRRKRKTGAES